MMDSVKIATQTVSKVAEIEVATRDAVAVEVVVAEADVAIVMTATIVASPSTRHLVLLTKACTDFFLSKATTSSKPTNHGAHLPANPNGKTNKPAKLSRKPKKKTRVQLVGGIPALLTSPPT